MIYDSIATPKKIQEAATSVEHGSAESIRVTNDHGVSLDFSINHGHGTEFIGRGRINGTTSELHDFVINLSQREYERMDGNQLTNLCIDGKYYRAEKILMSFFCREIGRIRLRMMQNLK